MAQLVDSCYKNSLEKVYRQICGLKCSSTVTRPCSKALVAYFSCENVVCCAYTLLPFKVTSSDGNKIELNHEADMHLSMSLTSACFNIHDLAIASVHMMGYLPEKTILTK